MTQIPSSSAIVSPAWQTTRVGNRTMQSADAASIRYRFVGDGPLSQRDLVAETPRAQLLATSPAGPRLDRALRRFASQADAQSGLSTLQTVTLAPDVDAVSAASLRTYLADQPSLQNANAVSRRYISSKVRQGVEQLNGINGAFTQAGNVILMPDEARGLLASVGAYDPSAQETSGRSPAVMRDFLPHLLRHEIEHTVSQAGVRGSSSLEEGLAEALSTSPLAKRAGNYDLPAAAHRYGRTDQVSAAATAGWEPYPMEDKPTASKGKSSNAEYDRRHGLTTQLIKLAGINMQTTAGYADARDLLQGQSVLFVPGRIADKLIDVHQLDPSIRERLRMRVRDVTSTKAADPIGDLRRDFGIDTAG